MGTRPGRGNSFDAKPALRRHFLALRRAMPLAARRAESAVIGRRVLALLQALPAGRAVGLYAAHSDEVATRAIWQALRRRGVPCAWVRQGGAGQLDFACIDAWDALGDRGHGFCEPPAEAAALPFTQLGAVLVPGLAFDLRGARLGYGRGAYDRLLAALPATTWCIGLTFAACCVNRLPQQPHDVAMHWVVAPRAAMLCRSAVGSG